MSEKKLSILWHSPYDKGVLVGLLLGEGTESITSQGRGWYTPTITIYNTEIEIINLASKILNRAGIRYSFRCIDYRNKLGNKPLYRIDIKGIKSVLPLLETLRASLVGRKERLNDLVIEFSRSRINHMLKPYNKREFDIIKEIRSLNPRGVNIKEGCQ